MKFGLSKLSLFPILDLAIVLGGASALGKSYIMVN
jgi:hypothetical protein